MSPLKKWLIKLQRIRRSLQKNLQWKKRYTQWLDDFLYFLFSCKTLISDGKMMIIYKIKKEINTIFNCLQEHC